MVNVDVIRRDFLELLIRHLVRETEINFSLSVTKKYQPEKAYGEANVQEVISETSSLCRVVRK
jgi:hypothetical protein